MSKMDDIFGRRYDQRLLVKVARPMKQEIKDLMFELMTSSYAEIELGDTLDTYRDILRAKIAAL